MLIPSPEIVPHNKYSYHFFFHHFLSFLSSFLPSFLIFWSLASHGFTFCTAGWWCWPSWDRSCSPWPKEDSEDAMGSAPQASMARGIRWRNTITINYYQLLSINVNYSFFFQRLFRHFMWRRVMTIMTRCSRRLRSQPSWKLATFQIAQHMRGVGPPRFKHLILDGGKEGSRIDVRDLWSEKGIIIFQDAGRPHTHTQSHTHVTHSIDIEKHRQTASVWTENSFASSTSIRFYQILSLLFFLSGALRCFCSQTHARPLLGKGR